jgi:uncharacterized protein
MAAAEITADREAATPSEPSRRLGALDALRGFALCGIFLINIQGMGLPIDAHQPLSPPSLNDPAWQIWWTSVLLIEGAMRALFSLLFGAGFLLFLREPSAGTAGEPGRRRLFARRAAWLIVFGLFNAWVLLWPGDILLIYGIAALLILPLAGCSNRTLLIMALALMAALSVWSAWDAMGGGPADAGALAEIGREVARERAARLGGVSENFAYIAQVNIAWTLTPFFVWWVLDAAAMMMVGMVLLRRRILTGEASTGVYAWLALAGLGAGMTLGAAAGWADYMHWLDEQPIAGLLMQPRKLALGLGWIGLFFLVLRSGVARPLMRGFEALGRVALSGYLLQSLIGALIFSGFGLGLWGRLDGWALWALVPVVMAIEAALAIVWLSHFRFGPAEWLWRTLTYGRAPPMVRRRPATGA